MDGRGRAMDNIFTERLQRSMKYEKVYINDYQTPPEAKEGISKYPAFYNIQFKVFKFSVVNFRYLPIF